MTAVTDPFLPESDARVVHARALWRQCRTFDGLLDLNEAFLLDVIKAEPGGRAVRGPRNCSRETDEIMPHLLHLNRRGLLTVGSQPFRCTPGTEMMVSYRPLVFAQGTYRQVPWVVGWVTPPTLERLRYLTAENPSAHAGICLPWDSQCNHDPADRATTKCGDRGVTFACEWSDWQAGCPARALAWADFPAYEGPELTPIGLHGVQWDVRDEFWPVVTTLFDLAQDNGPLPRRHRVLAHS